jgi:hypothetical protein
MKLLGMIIFLLLKIVLMINIYIRRIYKYEKMIMSKNEDNNAHIYIKFTIFISPLEVFVIGLHILLRKHFQSNEII